MRPTPASGEPAARAKRPALIECSDKLLFQNFNASRDGHKQSTLITAGMPIYPVNGDRDGPRCFERRVNRVKRLLRYCHGFLGHGHPFGLGHFIRCGRRLRGNLLRFPASQPKHRRHKLADSIKRSRPDELRRASDRHRLATATGEPQADRRSPQPQPRRPRWACQSAALQASRSSAPEVRRWAAPSIATVSPEM